MSASLRQSLVLFAVLAGAVTASAGLVGWLTSKSRSWEFIQQTGGIRIGQPAEREGHLMLPVEYDVSGSVGVTVRPTLINSGLAVRRISLNRAARGRIELTVVTQMVEKDSDTGRMHYAALEDYAAGTYEVYYGDAGSPARFLGTIQLR